MRTDFCPGKLNSGSVVVQRVAAHIDHSSLMTGPNSSAPPKRTPRYGTLEQLAAARKKQMVPDSSYALGKPAHELSHRDLFLARKFDRDNKGFLTESEQGDAKEALAGGLGKDHYSDYFSYKPTTRFQSFRRR